MSSNVASQFDRPQKASFQIFEIDPGELDRILSRCRQEGTILQGALLSALLLTLPGEGTLSCLAPINVRKLLPNVIDDFGLYISSGMATLDRNASIVVVVSSKVRAWVFVKVLICRRCLGEHRRFAFD